MEKLCENCGSEITPEDDFCPECGQRIEDEANVCESCGERLHEASKFCPNCGESTKKKARFCENCGNRLEDGEEFCSECGKDLNALPKESFTEKNKKALIVGGVIIIALIAVIAITSFISYNQQPVELPDQTVTVGAEYFVIPGDFYSSPTSFDVDTSGGTVSFSDSWKNDRDALSISIISSGYDVDLESVVSSQGGVKKSLMGYDGYYKEIDVNDYCFAFILDGKICVIETTSPHVFDEIEVQ